MGRVAAKPVVKFTTAWAERVPPAPWVKIKDVGASESEASVGGRERRQGIGVVDLDLADEEAWEMVNGIEDEDWFLGELKGCEDGPGAGLVEKGDSGSACFLGRSIVIMI